MTTPSENPGPYGGDPDGYDSEYGRQPYADGPYSPGAQPDGFGSPYGGPQHSGQADGWVPYQDYPYGTQPYGAQPFGAQHYGDQPYGTPPFGQQPYGSPHYGVQPYGPGHGAMQPYGPAYGATRREPALSLVLSFFLPGLGTMINGQAIKGIGIMAGYFLGMVLSVVLIGIPIMLGFWVWGMIDGYSGAKDHNRRNGFH